MLGAWSAPAAPRKSALIVVVTEQGKPVAGAEVLLVREDHPDDRASSDALGQARFHLEPGVVRVSATAHGATVNRVVTLSPLLGDARVELTFGPSGRIGVTVTDAKTRQPLAGALVELHHSANEPRQVLAAIKTDAAGLASIAGLTSNRYLLSVSREGYVSERCMFIETGTELPLELSAYEPASGVVLLPNRAPAPAALVSTIPLSWEQSATATTASDGTFTLPFTSRLAGLCARLGDLAGGGRLDEALDGGIVLAPALRFEGRVVRAEDDSPLEGVRVHHIEGALEVETFTAADGRFSLPGLCHPEPYATFERAGFVGEGELLSLDEPPIVRLSSPAAVRGIVVDDEGRPVSDAVVTLRDPEQVTTTDAEGRFGFERVKREVDLSVLEGHRGGFTQTTVEAGQLVEVTISIGPVLMKVPLEVLENGALADGVWSITAKRMGGRPFEEKLRWRQEYKMSDQRFPTAIDLPEGSFKVTARNEGAAGGVAGGGETEFRVTTAQPHRPLRIHVVEDPPPPPEPTRPLRVLVLDALGSPAPDAGLTCIASKWGTGVTGSDGRGACAMPEDSELPGEVKTRVGGKVASGKPTDWNAEVVLRLSGGMTIRGHVIGDAGTRASINWDSKEGQESFPFTPPDFLLEDRLSVRSILCVWGGGAQGCTVVPAAEGEVEAIIPVGPSGAVSFTVADARGQPVDQPILYVDRHSVPPPVDAGVVTLWLPPGQHLLIINVPGPERYETIVTVESGQVRALGRIELR